MTLHFKTDAEIQWRCNIKTCQKRVSIRKDTWFEGSTISFVTALRFIYSWRRELTSIEWGKEELEISDKTVINWNNYLREVCEHSLLSRPKKKIGGPNLTVEIDESLFSKRKNHAGRVLPEQWMFGGTCKKTNECFIVKVPDRTAVTLIEAIKDNIEEGSIIYSDSWKGYKTDDIRAANFEHFKVNHTYFFVDPDTGVHTQNIERLWGSAKSRNKRQRGTARHHLDSYMAEFMWRRLHKQDDDMFVSILRAIAQFMPPQ